VGRFASSVNDTTEEAAMTYDPNNSRNRQPYRRTDGDDSNLGMIIGACIAVALIVGGFYAFSGSNNNTRTAENTSLTRSLPTATPSSNNAPAPAASSAPTSPASTAPNR